MYLLSIAILVALALDIALARRWQKTINLQLHNQRIVNKNLAGAVIDLKRETPVPLVVRSCWSDDEKKTTRFSPVDNAPFRW